MTFGHQSIMNQHIATVHEGKKPFKCEACDARFGRKDTMNQHIEAKHEGKKPFKCEACDAKFTTKQSMTNHIESKHKEKNPFEGNQSLDCYIWTKGKPESTYCNNT